MDDLAALKVLIADDEPLAAERLQLLLARCDGTVTMEALLAELERILA